MPVPMTNPAASVWPSHLEPPAHREPITRQARLPRRRPAAAAAPAPTRRAPRQRYVTAAREILLLAANLHGLTLPALLADGQNNRQCDARRWAALEMRAKRMTFDEIGQVMGRHPTSILNLLKRRARSRKGNEWNPDVPDLSGEWAI